MNEIKLPMVTNNTSEYLKTITSSLSVPRDILASDEDIKEAWLRLPRVLSKIPKELITKWVAKMCIAVSTGLFDSWINYIWNESIIELRKKIITFWLANVWEILNKRNFDEKWLNDLRDSELLNLCLDLNLITEEWFFYLDQCRDIRNNFSVAHPTIWELDDNELINFTNRCVKYALSNDNNLVWININEFLTSLKESKFNDVQLDLWCDRLKQTYEAQRELLFWTLYSLYCDPDSNEGSRINAINIFLKLKKLLSPLIKSDLLEKHQKYKAKWIINSLTASQQFFERLSILDLLWDSEQHALIKKACDNLMDSHLWMNNFYNEPPFAERLQEITKNIQVPDSIKYYFIETIFICWIWNWFWVSNKALPFYEEMVSNLSPREISILFEMIENDKSNLWSRLKYWWNRKNFFKKLLLLIDEKSIPIKLKNVYNKWIK